jgi:hypothetical protein
MARVNLKTQRTINRIVSHINGVVDAVYDAAEDHAENARAILARHRDTGDTTIEARRKNDVDSEVVMSASDSGSKGANAALAIETGHDTENGKHVPGIHALRHRHRR